MFDINWSRKIKITINGKEYARLGDVPEEFRALLKNSAGQAKRTWRFSGFVNLGGVSEALDTLGGARSIRPTAFNSTTTASSGASRGAGSRGMR